MAWESRIVGEGTEDPTQLLANPLNWRTHPYEQKEALKGALDEIGWIQRVIVNKTTGHVVDGHARIELALSNDQAEIPVLYVELTEEEEKLALATIDPIGAMATTDATKLQELLADVETDSDALQAVLDDISGAETMLMEGETDPDAVPEAPKAAKSISGKIYDLGSHRLMCGSSTEPELVADLMSGKKANAVVTDPPYGIGADKTMAEKSGQQYGNAAAPKRTYRDTDWDKLPEKKSIDALTDYDQAIIFGGNYFDLPPSRCWLVWDKENGSNQFADCELAWSNLDMPVRIKRHMWNGMIRKGGEDRNEHPTQKPMDVMVWACELTTGTIFDPYLGSGSTLIACEKLGRSCYGMELDEKYCDVIRKRWAEFVHGEGCDWEELTPETV